VATNDTAVKPVPVPDEDSAGFWEATAQHQLAIRRCSNCGWYGYPPVMLCHNCLSPERRFHYEPVSGRGRIKTWTVLHQAFLPGFRGDVPYVVAVVELEEQPGLRMNVQLVDTPIDAVAIGVPVEVVFDDVAEGVSVPHFTVVGAR
jgi:uncharacterized OB-fold protein